MANDSRPGLTFCSALFLLLLALKLLGRIDWSWWWVLAPLWLGWLLLLAILAVAGMVYVFKA